MSYSAESEFQKGFKTQWIVLAVGLVLLVAKFSAFIITSSNAILSDALESIVNVAAGSIALYSLYLSAKPKDYNHPYGHGKIEFITAGLEGTMVVFAGLVIIYKAMRDLIVQPNQVENLDIGLAITLFAGTVNYILGFVLVRKGKSIRSAVLIADGKHLKSDAYTSLGLLIGLAVVYFSGVLWLDNIIALIFAVIIIVMGVRIVRESLRDIMDEIDFNEAKTVIESLNKIRRPAWIDVHNLRIIKFGPSLHIDCHLTIPYYYDMNQGHAEIEFLDEKMNKELDPNIEFFVHIDPCTFDSCNICSMPNCPVRKHKQERKIKWELENVLMNQKHGGE
ncbi:MAG: cation diffusion facilitator family transporter [Chitinophagales bacterium]